MRVEQALQLLEELGGPRHLVRHHELVVEAARQLCAGIVDALGPAADETVSEARVLAGAALHDAGKVVHPEEMHAPGHAHEHAGQTLLLEAGVSEDLASFCVSHAAWRDHPENADVLLVALADKLWKGRRESDLEQLCVRLLSRSLGLEQWDAYARLDAVFEAVAAEGPARLSRSTES